VDRHQYKNPPIKEAVFEFRFAPEADEWDPTIPGRLYTEIKDKYSGKPREKSFLRLEPKGEARPEPRVIFSTADGSSLLVVGRDLLSVNALQPYQGWAAFRERIAGALDTYKHAAQPKGVKRVGVRYINQILIPKESTTPERYLNGVSAEVDGLPKSRVELLSRGKYRYDDGTQLIVTHSFDTEQKDKVGILLDLDLAWIAADDELIEIEKLMSIVDKLRDRERSAFESLITDEARALFDDDPMATE